MLKKLRDELSERTKLIIYTGICAAVFIASCLLPLAFAGRGAQHDPGFDTGARSDMFIAYRNGDKSLKTKVLDSVHADEEAFCKDKMEELSSLCRIDGKSGKIISSGSEYLTVSDGENSLRLCRMWVQDEGDWTNWMDVYFDVDTGFVYYLYVSSINLNNSSDYLDVLDSSFNSKAVADRISETTGFSLKHFSWSGKVEDSAYAVTGSDGDIVCWNINCTYYAAAMIDVKISVA